MQKFQLNQNGQDFDCYITQEGNQIVTVKVEKKLSQTMTAGFTLECLSETMFYHVRRERNNKIFCREADWLDLLPKPCKDWFRNPEKMIEAAMDIAKL